MKKVNLLINSIALMLPMTASWCGEYEPSLHMIASSNTLTVNIKEAPLIRVLRELTKIAAIPTEFDASSAHWKVTAEFRDFPFHDAIRRLLQGQSYVVIHANRSSNGEEGIISKPKKIIVLSSDAEYEGSTRSTISLSPNVNHGEEPQQLTLEWWEGADTDARIQALMLLDTSAGQDIAGVLNHAIQDEHVEVRQTALAEIAEIEDPWRTELLTDMASTDPSPELQREALDLLMDLDQEAAWAAYLQQATNHTRSDL